MSHVGEFLFTADNCQLHRAPLCSFKFIKEDSCKETVIYQNKFILSSLQLENTCDVPKVDDCPRLYIQEGNFCFAKFDLLKVNPIVILFYFIYEYFLIDELGRGK